MPRSCGGTGKRPPDGKDEMGLPRWGDGALDNRVDQFCPGCSHPRCPTQPAVSEVPGEPAASVEDAYTVEEFIGKVTQWKGTDEDEHTEAKEAAERLAATLESGVRDV